MKYEIEIIDDLYCVFKDSRIIGAYNTKQDALKAIEKEKQYEAIQRDTSQI